MGETQRIEAVRGIMEQFYGALCRQDLDSLRAVTTEDWQYVPPAPGQHEGVAGILPMLSEFADAFPDMKIEVLDVLVHDKLVGVRARVTGTHLGPLVGIAPTSKAVDFAIHSFHELHGDLIAKTWHLEDWLGLFKQLGEFPDQV